jgi:hypothetical protein
LVPEAPGAEAAPGAAGGATPTSRGRFESATTRRTCSPGSKNPVRTGREPAVKIAVLDSQPSKTYQLVFDPDEEVMGGLVGFVKEKGITAGHFTAIGAI